MISLCLSVLLLLFVCLIYLGLGGMINACTWRTWGYCALLPYPRTPVLASRQPLSLVPVYLHRHSPPMTMCSWIVPTQMVLFRPRCIAFCFPPTLTHISETFAHWKYNSTSPFWSRAWYSTTRLFPNALRRSPGTGKLGRFQSIVITSKAAINNYIHTLICIHARILVW